MRPPRKLLLATLVLLFQGSITPADASPGSILLKSLSRYATKEAAGESAEKLTKEVGEVVVERVATTVVKEGGEQSLEQVSVLVAKHGPDIVRALSNAPSVTPVLKALEDLPADQVAKAAGRLAAGKQGRELAATTIRYGSSVLRAELSHPGVGGHFMRALGNDGASLCGKLSKDQAIALGRYVDDVARVPPPQRRQLIDLIGRDKDRFFEWLGRFVDKNPGKTIGSVTLLGVFLPNSERLLGGDDIVIGPDDEPRVITKPGIAGHIIDTGDASILKPVGEGISGLLRGVTLVLVLGIGGFAVIKLWGVWRRERSQIFNSNDRNTTNST